jgi:hypothetical protein
LGYPPRNHNVNSSFEPFKNERETTQEREEHWFLGTLIQFNSKVPSHFYRLKNLHNCITHNETGCDNRFQINQNIASRLAEFFPLKWLDVITNTFKKTNAKELSLRLEEDRLYAYLAYIDLLLIFRGLNLLDSTLEEINKALGVNLNKNKLRTWRLNLLKLYPDLRDKWRRVRSETPSRTLIATLIRVLNSEMNFENYSERDIFEIKHQTLKYGQKFASLDRITRIKRIETWARALCLKAVRDVKLSYSIDIFRNLPEKEFVVLENKRWQLDKILTVEKIK